MGPDAEVGLMRAPGARIPGVVRVALVDDHHLIREGLRLVLEAEPGISIVGEAADHPTAVDLVVAERPDVLLLDLTFPEGDALPLVRALRARQPDLRIVVLTMHSDPETVRQALAAGASGYIVKGAHSRELIEAVRAVARGDRYLHSSVTNTVVEDSLRWFESGTLSGREREVLSLLASRQRLGQARHQGHERPDPVRHTPGTGPDELLTGS
jgi:DNA-binding NarL/FixJ family response regulator